ncbi:hypothetical protein SELMODRAFT_443565 [Selaginella moellendorffii]|uniref:RING-type domain-containing protein n=1 Tax=Selaginella moellendorffii TaxID=88036 RepID=D8S292_SELML|nr:hypothetical protein SELMODRAFT_443565 [Selaginella moellendorffii]
MSSVPTPASGSTLSNRQFSEDAQSHGTAKLPAAAAAGASCPEHETSKIRALNPLAREFVPVEEGSPSSRSPTKRTSSREEFPSAPRNFSDHDAAATSSESNSGVKENWVESGMPHKQSQKLQEVTGGLSAALKVPQAGKSSLKMGHEFTSSQHSTQPSSSRRGQTWNANHLLNFHYDPIVRPSPRPPQRRQHQKVQAYDKELFLQANFRFLVSDFGDYLENSTDPDKMLEWEDIALVELSSSVAIQCPICLESPPLCPQITSCGHVFCFPCILRYFSDADHKTHVKKCPLCFGMTSPKELRTVYIHNVKEHRLGDNVGFTLLTRDKGSVIPFKRNESRGSPAYTKDGRCHLYSKFTLTCDVEMTTNNAVSELTAWAERAQSGDDEDIEQLPFVFAAIDELKSRKAAWDEHRTLEFISSSPSVRQRIMAQVKAGITKLPGEDFESSSSAGKHHEKQEVLEPSPPKQESVYHINPFTDERELVDVDKKPKSKDLHQEDAPEDWESITSPVKTATHKDAKDAKHEETDSYSFYQAADGQLVILHPLTMKCLVHHYGSYTSLPSRVEGKILEMEAMIQTELLRKRYRYLSHLPLTSTFQLCEVDLSKILPSSSLSPFKDELHAREVRRQRRLKQEKMLKSAGQRLEEKVVPPSPADYIAIMNALHEDEVPNDSEFVAPSTAPVPASSPPVDERRLFSRVAKLGFASGHDAPDLTNDGLSSNRPPIQQQSPWNQKQAPAGSSSGGASLSFADAIQRKVEKKTPEAPSRGAARKGKVLLSTGSGRKTRSSDSALLKSLHPDFNYRRFIKSFRPLRTMVTGTSILKQPQMVYYNSS